MKFLFVFCASFLLIGCGYQIGHQGISSNYSTISLPYVKEDLSGGLTRAIAHQIVRSGAFEYRSDNGQLLLLVEVIDLDKENIGFRYDYDRHRSRESVIPTETRLTKTVEISLLEASTGRVLLSPVRISASVDVDHYYNSDRNGRINTISLGQLSEADSAFEAAERPLNAAVALKVVDYIIDSW